MGPSSRAGQKERVQRFFQSGAEMVIGDLARMDISSHLEDVDTIIDLATFPCVRAGFGENFPECVRSIILATQKLLDASRLKSRKLRAFIHASSSSIYGNAEQYPTPEGAMPSPISPYGVTKLASEQLVLGSANRGEVPGIALRFFTVYGPGQRPDFAISRFIQCIKESRPIRINGDGAQQRDIVEVSDVVRGIILAACSEKSGRTYNIAGGISVGINHILKHLEKFSKKMPEIQYGPKVKGDVTATEEDISRAGEELGWRPKFSWQDGLEKQWVAANEPD